jgi:hypothetical protein
MPLPLRAPAQDPKYARYWNQQHQLDYWIFGLLLLVVLPILYGLFAVSPSDTPWLDRLISQNVRVVAAGGIPRAWPWRPRRAGSVAPQCPICKKMLQAAPSLEHIKRATCHPGGIFRILRRLRQWIV